MVPLVLLTTSLPPARVWQVSSLGWAIFQIAILSFRRRQARQLGLTMTKVVAPLVALMLASIALQLWNGFFRNQAGPHLVGLAANLLMAMGAFFILVHDDETSEP